MRSKVAFSVDSGKKLRLYTADKIVALEKSFGSVARGERRFFATAGVA